MIWTILGISVAIVAIFCITVAETLVGQPVFEQYRPYAAVGLGVCGAVFWFLGRAIAARDARAEQPSRRFLLFDLRYWGPMFLALGSITLFIRPLRTANQEVAEVPRPAPKREVRPEPKPAPAVIVAKAAPRTFPTVRLQGIVFRESRPVVILDGHSYTVGDKFGDATVRAIDRSSVMLELDGEMKVLTVN